MVRPLAGASMGDISSLPLYQTDEEHKKACEEWERNRPLKKTPRGVVVPKPPEKDGRDDF